MLSYYPKTDDHLASAHSHKLTVTPDKQLSMKIVNLFVVTDWSHASAISYHHRAAPYTQIDPQERTGALLNPNTGNSPQLTVRLMMPAL